MQEKIKIILRIIGIYKNFHLSSEEILGLLGVKIPII